MALIDQLYSASFRGAQFLVNSHEKESGRKIAVHEFPNKNGRYVEDLGGFLRTFKINGVISQPNYFEKRQALETALETPGIGTLIHPFYGTIQVVPDVYKINEDMQRLGECLIEMTFYEAEENIYPTLSPNNQSIINNLAGQTLASAQSSVSQLWYVTNQYRYNYLTAQNTLNDVGYRFSNIANPFNSSSLGRSQYNQQVNNYLGSVTKIINSPSQVGSSINGLFASANNLSTQPRQQFNTATKFFNYGDYSILPPPTTFKRQQMIQNTTAVYSQMNVASLANAYNAAAQIDFTDENDLNSVEDTLDQQYYFCIDNSNFPTETIDILNNLRDQVRLYFDRIRLDVRKLVPIMTNQSTITTLTYAYYNALDNDELIADINGITVPNNVAGNIQIVTNQ